MAQQINLYNPIFLQEKKHFSAVTMLQALGLLLAGVLVFYGYAINESRTLARAASDTQRQLQTQAEQVTRMTLEFSPEGRSKLLGEEMARATARLKQREELLAVLRTGGLGNTEGFARYLSAFSRQTTPGVWLTGFTIGGDEAELQLKGRVLHPDLVPAYIRVLNREEVMRGRRVAEMRLTAREERLPEGTSAPGAPPSSVTPPATPPPAPFRYVEFSIAAVRGTGAAPAGSTEDKAAK